jgi:tetratricopeptide (TPR) repeat protein
MHRPRLTLASAVRALRSLAGIFGSIGALASTDVAAAQSAGDSLRVLERAVDSLRTLGRDRELAKAYQQLGDLHATADRGAAAVEAYRLSLVHARAANDSTAMAVAHNDLGLAHWSANRYDSALTNLEASRELRQATNDRRGLGLVLNNIGASYYQLGQYEPALDAFMQSLAIRREEGDGRSMAVILTNIGKTYQDFRQYDRAREVLAEAVASAESVGAPAVVGYALHTLGVLELEQGNLARASELFTRSTASYADSAVSRTDSIAGWMLNAVVRGRLYVREGRPYEAIALLDSVLIVSERRSSVRGQARTLLHLGEAYRAIGERERAISALLQSLAFSRGAEQRVLALEAVALLADLEEEAGRSASALGHLRAAQALRDTIFDQATAQRIAAMEARERADRQARENAKLREVQAVQREVIARQRTVVILVGVILLLTVIVLVLVSYFLRRGRAREALLRETNGALEEANTRLQTALSDVRTLTGLIPICAHCKKVRDDQGYWEAVETYVGSRSDATFSHSICSACGPELYGEHWPTELTEPAAPER